MRPSAAILFILGIALAGCSSGRDEVVVYAALDREFSEPILNDFTKATGVGVVAKYDVESTKTVGLTQAIMAEANRPRCDVFWNNEILNTIRLEEKGLLAVYRSPAAESYPEQFRSNSATWHGFAGRARVLIVNTKDVPTEEMPKSIYDMAKKKWKGKVVIAKTLFGTTATHAACLFAALGDEKAKEFFQSL
ncbi:MAG: ABC transporter substrate-binding protein, partial [Planctomycetales bacterium]|nr:ABC transporter substrate-binding protein [Planctomycetales bacterium]